MKYACLFPGQGSQVVGMGKALAETFPESRAVFDQADRLLGFSISSMCFDGPQETLTATSNAQPAILTASIAAWEVLKKMGIRPAAVAGHSLGQYTALVAAQSLTFEEAVRVTRRRGEYMEQAVNGAMAAILGLDRAALEALCQRVVSPEVADVANFNSPDQIVISGSVNGVRQVCDWVKAETKSKAIPLNVSGAFHSRLMTAAKEGLRQTLEKTVIQSPVIPVVNNVTGDFVSVPAEILETLMIQVMKPVLWEQSIRRMLADGIDTFIEVGPGRVLSGLIRRIDRTAKTYQVEDPKGIEDVSSQLGLNSTFHIPHSTLAKGG